MAQPTTPATASADLARLLVAVADADTVHRDVHLRRARAALATELPLDRYRGLCQVQQKVESTVGRSRSAAIVQDWALVKQLATEADQLRRTAEASAGLQAVGALVYDAPLVALDPFSPGLAALAKAPDLAKLRDDAVAALAKVAAADTANAAYYESRRAWLGGLALTRRAASIATEKAATQSVTELERAAFEAAQRGDTGELQRLASEILARQAETPAAPRAAHEPAAAPPPDAGACPVDLGAAFAAGIEAQARALGLAVARTEPLPQAAPLFDYVAARVGQAALQDATSELEGTMRIEALVDQSAWPAGAAEHLKTLVGQLVRNVFVSSGGARYRPVFATESVLIEDFPEDVEPPATSPLLTALGLLRRRGLTRDEIEAALLAHGDAVLRDGLGLDPVEFRLVCIPQDLYSRFGRDRGWGAAKHWTHFDGYQVLKSGQLRALVGGDARYGGLNDLASIAASDQRDSVTARFAVLRRARQVARWR